MFGLRLSLEDEKGKTKLMKAQSAAVKVYF